MFAAVLFLTPLLTLQSDLEQHPWQGCWQTVEGKEFFWFEPERCGRLRGDEPTFYRVDYERIEGAPGEYGERARLESWSRLTEIVGRLEGESLVLEIGGKRYTLERTDVPSALLVQPYQLPTDIEVDEDTVAVVQEELHERRREDQRVRTDPALRSNPKAWLAVDEDNTDFVRTLAHELGWIDAERFGREAADAAFLIVQHSADLRLMRTALPLIERDVRAKRLGGQAYALLWDRVQLRLGGKQRYGSQIGQTPDGQPVLMPCEDFGRIDEFRTEMGMGPLADYLKFFERDGQAVPRLEDVIEPLEASAGR